MDTDPNVDSGLVPVMYGYDALGQGCDYNEDGIITVGEMNKWQEGGLFKRDALVDK